VCRKGFEESRDARNWNWEEGFNWSLVELISTWKFRKEKWALGRHEVGKYEHSSEPPRQKG